MKNAIYYLIAIFFLGCITPKKINGVYEYDKEIEGFSKNIVIELKENGKFNYRELNDQIDYTTTKISYGKWNVKGKLIILKPDSLLKPRIEYRKGKLKDSLLIKVYDRNGNKFSDWFRFFGNNNKWVYSNSIGSKILIPLKTKVKTIEFQGRKLIKVKPDFNEIIIYNASKDTIYNFDYLKLKIKGRKLKTVNKIGGPTGIDKYGIFNKKR